MLRVFSTMTEYGYGTNNHYKTVSFITSTYRMLNNLDRSLNFWNSSPNKTLLLYLDAPSIGTCLPYEKLYFIGIPKWTILRHTTGGSRMAYAHCQTAYILTTTPTIPTIPGTSHLFGWKDIPHRWSWPLKHFWQMMHY